MHESALLHNPIIWFSRSLRNISYFWWLRLVRWFTRFNVRIVTEIFEHYLSNSAISVFRKIAKQEWEKFAWYEGIAVRWNIVLLFGFFSLTMARFYIFWAQRNPFHWCVAGGVVDCAQENCHQATMTMHASGGTLTDVFVEYPHQSNGSCDSLTVRLLDTVVANLQVRSRRQLAGLHRAFSSQFC